MRIKGNEIVVTRGESFTIDKYVVNKNGSPFIISDRLDNPYFLLTVASARYDASNKTIENFWLSLEGFPRFKNTIAVQKQADWNDFNEFKDVPVASIKENVYYYNNEYKYLKKDADNATDADNWLTYPGCRIVKTFTPDTTRRWTENAYKYAITLMAGSKTNEVINSLVESKLQGSIPLDFYSDYDKKIFTETGKQKVYEWLKSIDENLVKSINPSYPICNISYSVPILQMTNMLVTGDLNGGIYG